MKTLPNPYECVGWISSNLIGNEKFVPTRREEQLQVEWVSDCNRVGLDSRRSLRTKPVSKEKKIDMVEEITHRQ